MIIDLLVAGIIAAPHPTDWWGICTHTNPCLNGNIPSYSNPNCWPGAIYCPPPGTPPDPTVTDIHKLPVIAVKWGCHSSIFCGSRHHRGA